MKKDKEQVESSTNNNSTDKRNSSELLNSLEIPNDISMLWDAYQKLLQERNMLRKSLYAIQSSFPTLRF